MVDPLRYFTAGTMKPSTNEMESNTTSKARSTRGRGRPRAAVRRGLDAHTKDPREAIYVLHNPATSTAHVGTGSLRCAVMRYNADMRGLDPSGRLGLHTSSLCRWLGKEPSRRRAFSKGVQLLVFDRAQPPIYDAIAPNVVHC